MAIYNEEVKKYIYTRIGDDYKREAIEKSQKRRKRLCNGGVWTTVIGAIFLLIVIFRTGSAIWLYVLSSLITALGVALILSGVILYAIAKKKYLFDSYGYGERHYEEVLSKVKSEVNLSHKGVMMGIEYVDELIKVEATSVETRGSGSNQITYVAYKLTYSDGTVKEEEIKSSEVTLMSLLSQYDPNSKDKLKV